MRENFTPVHEVLLGLGLCASLVCEVQSTVDLPGWFRLANIGLFLALCTAIWPSILVFVRIQPGEVYFWTLLRMNLGLVMQIDGLQLRLDAGALRRGESDTGRCRVELCSPQRGTISVRPGQTIPVVRGDQLEVYVPGNGEPFRVRILSGPSRLYSRDDEHGEAAFDGRARLGC